MVIEDAKTFHTSSGVLIVASQNRIVIRGHRFTGEDVFRLCYLSLFTANCIAKKKVKNITEDLARVIGEILEEEQNGTSSARIERLKRDLERLSSLKDAYEEFIRLSDEVSNAMVNMQIL